MIFLHIGMSKTASSALQDIFKSYRNVKLKYQASKLLSTGLSVGSGNILLKDINKAYFESHSSDEDYIYSNENLVDYFLKNGLNEIQSLDTLRVLMVTRPLFDHAKSLYLQKIKRLEYKHSFDYYLNYDYTYDRALLNLAKEFKNKKIAVSYFHYDQMITGKILNYFSIPEDRHQVSKVVNRSLTLRVATCVRRLKGLIPNFLLRYRIREILNYDTYDEKREKSIRIGNWQASRLDEFKVNEKALVAEEIIANNSKLDVNISCIQTNLDNLQISRLCQKITIFEFIKAFLEATYLFVASKLNSIIKKW